jgi:hypothetical protein
MRKGMLGEPVFGECGYIHDLKFMSYADKEGEPATPCAVTGTFWRLKWNAAHKGNQYPTHGLGPICHVHERQPRRPPARHSSRWRRIQAELRNTQRRCTRRRLAGRS